LLADPQQLRQLSAELRADPPAHLAGLIWFRLPLANDRRAWSLTTLRAVVRGDALSSRLALKLSAQEGLYDIGISNEGNLDSAWPERVTLAARGCEGRMRWPVMRCNKARICLPSPACMKVE
jgi:hypothetical protein